MTTLTVNTNQEAFDTVARHIAAMPYRSIKANQMSCAYLSPEGLNCAIGALMPTDEDRRACDDAPSTSIRNLVLDGYVILYDVSVNLLSDLQSAHDCESSWNDDGFRAWGDLDNIADLYGLDSAVLYELRAERATVTA